jgi:hypothetical protein
MFSFSTMLALSRLFPGLRTMTEGAPSRRMVVKGLLAAVVASAPVGIGLDSVAGRRKRRRKHKKGTGGTEQTPLSCRGDSCDGTGGKACGGTDSCQCYRWATGGNVCASSLQSSCETTCQTDHDCPSGHVCVESGPACCGRGGRFCKAACSS